MCIVSSIAGAIECIIGGSQFTFLPFRLSADLVGENITAIANCLAAIADILTCGCCRRYELFHPAS